MKLRTRAPDVVNSSTVFRKVLLTNKSCALPVDAGMLKLMCETGSVSALASRIAWRNEPGPLSLVLVTRKLGRKRSSSISRTGQKGRATVRRSWRLPRRRERETWCLVHFNQRVKNNMARLLVEPIRNQEMRNPKHEI